MIIFMSIFAVVIIGLITIAFIGNKRDKNDKQIALDKLHAIEETAKDNHLKIYSVLNELILYIDTKQEEFLTNPALVSLGDVTKKANTVLNLLLDSTELKELYKSDDRSAEFKPVMKQLKESKPTNWRKEAFFAVSLIESKSKYAVPSETLTKIKKYLWN